MVKQVEDRLLLESFSIASLDFLTKGYLLNCRTENKSPKTISGYEMVLSNLSGIVNNKNTTEIQKLTAVHVKHFLWYVGSEPHRWSSNSPSAKRIANSATIATYFLARTAVGVNPMLSRTLIRAKFGV